MTDAILQARLKSRCREVLHRDELGACWEWQGFRNHARGGYGQMSYQAKVVTVHRLAYIAWIGEIPSELHVLHHCDNPPCTNPSHLFVGTNLDNMRDRDAKGRRWPIPPMKGVDHPRCRLSPTDLDEIRTLIHAGTRLAVIARRFGVARQTIWKIKHTTYRASETQNA